MDGTTQQMKSSSYLRSLDVFIVTIIHDLFHNLNFCYIILSSFTAIHPLHHNIKGWNLWQLFSKKLNFPHHIKEQFWLLTVSERKIIERNKYTIVANI